MINSIHAIKHHHQGLQPSNGEEKFIARIKAVLQWQIRLNHSTTGTRGALENPISSNQM